MRHQGSAALETCNHPKLERPKCRDGITDPVKRRPQRNTVMAGPHCGRERTSGINFLNFLPALVACPCPPLAKPTGELLRVSLLGTKQGEHQ